jgi:phosphoglycolate phosphatase-like HAD superfamily hydrolase
MKEMAIFDLDGTLIELRIDRDDFEACRAFWASYFTVRGVSTTLKPIWPELQRVLQTPLGNEVRADILKGLDALELAGTYGPLGQIDAILGAAKSQFRKLVLVTHNGAAFWQRVVCEHDWTQLFDVVITRDDLACFKPDLRACASVLPELLESPSASECWVIGNADVDRGLGLNLRHQYPHLVVRTFLIASMGAAATSIMPQLDVDITAVDALLEWMTLL